MGVWLRRTPSAVLLVSASLLNRVVVTAVHSVLVILIVLIAAVTLTQN
jgi:hypothetical protein